MTPVEPYPTPTGVESAIKQAARTAAAANPQLNPHDLIHQEYFRRFLSRVFSEPDPSGWVLKGGSSMLARIPTTRSTRDIDLYRNTPLADALTELKRLAALDLGDHFRFDYQSHTASLNDNGQPYADGYTVTFAINIGTRQRGKLKVDLVTGVATTGEVIIQEPAGALQLPRLVSHPYRLYPVVDQIADKVCATMSLYNGQPSSREKDLVDLVTLATTQTIDGTALRAALTTEAGRRKLTFDHFTIPLGLQVPVGSSLPVMRALGLAACVLQPVWRRRYELESLRRIGEPPYLIPEAVQPCSRATSEPDGQQGRTPVQG